MLASTKLYRDFLYDPKQLLFTEPLGSSPESEEEISTRHFPKIQVFLLLLLLLYPFLRDEWDATTGITSTSNCYFSFFFFILQDSNEALTDAQTEQHKPRQESCQQVLHQW